MCAHVYVCVYVCVHVCACICMSKNLSMRFSFLGIFCSRSTQGFFSAKLSPGKVMITNIYNLQALPKCTHLCIKMLLLAHQGLQLRFQTFLEECKNKESHNDSLENKVYNAKMSKSNLQRKLSKPLVRRYPSLLVCHTL